MVEVFGDLWRASADYRCITTNGTTTSNECNIMGGGCAREAAHLYPDLPRMVGRSIIAEGHHVRLIRSDLIMFPVKHTIAENASLDLIAQSCKELARLVVILRPYLPVLLPRPGCGLGGLKWEDVKPVIEPLLSDDRIQVIHYGK